MNVDPAEYRDCRSEGELAALSDEALLAYIVAEREADRPHCVKRAVSILAFGYEDFIRYRVVEKVPPEDVDDVVGTVIESVVKSAFDGRSVGELRSWLKVIAQRRIADYYDGRERSPDTRPLPDGGGDDSDDGTWGAEPGIDDETDVIAIREAAGRVLETRSDVHQHVIRLYGPNELGYMALGAAEAARIVADAHAGSMSEANVHQIWRRYKSDLDGELGVGGS
jgi:DNA-directed RNA polymerase specialized sigma24 family protein